MVHVDNAQAESVGVERTGAAALIRLNEPATLNSLSAGIKAGLAAAEGHCPDHDELPAMEAP